MQKLRRAPAVAVTAVDALYSFLFVCAGLAPAPSSSPAPIDKARFIAHEDVRISAGLREPESARFRKESISTNRAGATLCGQAPGYVRGWPATPLAAGSALRASRRPRPCLWGF